MPATTRDTKKDTKKDTDAANVVRLSGRVTAAPEERELPSGDRLVALRVLVPRADDSRGDSIPVVVGPAPASGTRRGRGQASATVVKRAAQLEVGDEVTLEGWLQRRFWETAGGVRASRLQVVATTIARTR